MREPLAAAIAAARAAAAGDTAPIVVANKIDLAGIEPRVAVEQGTPIVYVSALTGAGIEALVAQLKASAGVVADSGGTFSARRRHLDALVRTRGHLAAARPQLLTALELAAEHLRQAQTALSELTGRAHERRPARRNLRDVLHRQVTPSGDDLAGVSQDLQPRDDSQPAGTRAGVGNSVFLLEPAKWHET